MQTDLVNEAQNIIMRGEGKLLKVLPAVIARIIHDNAWADKLDKENQPFSNGTFKRFVEYPLPRGLETPWSRLLMYCEHEPEVYTLLLELEPEASRQGGANNPEGIGGKSGKKADCQVVNYDLTNPKRNTGNAAPERVRARLKRDRKENPKAGELYERLIAGEISARKAALEMGWVKPADPARIVEKQVAAMEPEELIDVYRNLTRSLPESHWDHLEAAKEAVRNLNDIEYQKFALWLKAERNQKKAMIG